jgi:hypothetical protein
MKDTWNELRALNYQQLEPQIGAMRGYQLTGWGGAAAAEDLESAARGLLAAQTPTEQIQHLRIFARGQFPLHPKPLIELALSSNEQLARAAAVALSRMTDPSVRDLAFHLVQNRCTGHEYAIAMLDQNFESNDHEIALRWFENEPDRKARHRLGMDLVTFWEHHQQPTAESRVLLACYEKQPCSFCREYVVRRLIELDAHSPTLRAECAYDANEDIRRLVSPDPPVIHPSPSSC